MASLSAFTAPAQSGPHAAGWWPLRVSYLPSLIGPPQAGHMVMLWQDGQGRSAMSLMSSGPVGSILPAVPGSDGQTEDGRQDESWLTVRQLPPVLNYASAAAFVLPKNGSSEVRKPELIDWQRPLYGQGQR